MSSSDGSLKPAWQARDDQDKEWDSQGNMNNVVRVPPQPAHVAQLEVAAHPALDLPNATVITPAADDKPSPVVLSDAPPANKEEVSKGASSQFGHSSRTS